MAFSFPTTPAWILDTRARFPQLFLGLPPYMFECGEGWKGIVTDLCERLETLARPQLKIAQIKEKFGDLRVYVEGGDEAAHALIRKAEACSSTICEWCGAANVLNLFWLPNVCQKCSTALLPSIGVTAASPGFGRC